MTASNTASWVLSCLVALGVAVGCGGDERPDETPPSSEAPTPTPEPAAGGAATPPAGQPAAAAPAPSAKAGVRPEGYPSDVPLHPSARVASVQVSNDGRGTLFGFELDEDVASVGAHYADALGGGGWTTNIQDEPAGRMIFAQKGSRAVTFVIHTRGEKTRVDVAVFEGN